MSGVHLVPSSRRIDARYRSGKILAIPVTSLFEDISMRVSCIVKGSAIKQDLLKPLGVEALLGFTNDFEMLAPLDPSLVEQAITCI